MIGAPKITKNMRNKWCATTKVKSAPTMMAKTTNSPCPPGANDKIASTGLAKLSIKTKAKTEVVLQHEPTLNQSARTFPL